MIARRAAVFGAVLFFSSIAFADFQWSDNSTWDRARTIAPQQNSWSFRTSYQAFDSRFGSTGEVQALGRQFDRTWTWKQILAAETSTTTKALLQNYQKGIQAADNDVAASSVFDLKRQETTMEMAWAYGLTEHWMIGVQVPISLVDTQVEPSTSLAPVLGSLQVAASTTNSQAVRQRIQTLVQDRLAAEGYGPVLAHTQNFIVGDVSLLNQVSLWRNPDWAVALQGVARVPSAPNSNVADYIRYSRGDGQISLGLSALADYKWRRFLFGGKIGYLRSIPDTQKMRVPSATDETKIVDGSVSRDLGDLLSLSFETFYSLARRWTINSAYLGFFKGVDHYSGESDGVSYAGLGADTAEQLHIVRVGLSYLIGKPSSRSGVERKWVANFNFYQPVAGLNVSDGSQAALELQAFF